MAGVVCVVLSPCLRVALSSLCCLAPPRIILASLLSVYCLLLWVGKCGVCFVVWRAVVCAIEERVCAVPVSLFLCFLLSCIARIVFAVTALLVWWCVFVTGLCHCGIAVMVCVRRKGAWCLLSTVDSLCVVLSCCLVVLWVVEWRWCVGV